MKVLITGGLGFVGSYLARALVAAGESVRVLDAGTGQVHGEDPQRAVPPGTEWVAGDVADRAAVERALAEVDRVVHLAAEVGVGQSMYEVRRYVRTNSLGTATLMEALLKRREQVRRLVVASSNTTYGEGSAACSRCGRVDPPLRTASQLEARNWEVRCPACGEVCTPAPTPEERALRPTSVYAISKQDTEQLALCIGQAYGIPTVVLRFFNIYGAGQSLQNPYAGIAKNFAVRLLHGLPPLIYEDGCQTRDLVHVSDIVQGIRLALAADPTPDAVFNLGTGRPTRIADLARLLARTLGLGIEPEITGQFRTGDIRHCIADISRAEAQLGYRPAVTLETGIPELAQWIRSQETTDLTARAQAELSAQALVR